LDFSAGQAGGGQFDLQTTERSNSKRTPEDPLDTLSVQCNSDEVVTGGGFSQSDLQGNLLDLAPIESKKLDNGWSLTWNAPPDIILTVYAECLKVVNAEGTTG
jgi:hypothetical protein